MEKINKYVGPHLIPTQSQVLSFTSGLGWTRVISINKKKTEKQTLEIIEVTDLLKILSH